MHFIFTVYNGTSVVLLYPFLSFFVLETFCFYQFSILIVEQKIAGLPFEEIQPRRRFMEIHTTFYFIKLANNIYLSITPDNDTRHENRYQTIQRGNKTSLIKNQL